MSEFLEVEFVDDPRGNESQRHILGFVRNAFQKQGWVNAYATLILRHLN